MTPVLEVETEYGTIRVTRAETGALTYEVGGRRQGAADESGTSLAYYIHALFGLLMQAGARDVLMIGGAGCTLGTMLARKGRKATIVDVNPLSFDVARRHFGLPGTVACHVADGAAFLRAHGQSYDAVVLDAFHGDDIPDHLLTPEFFALARERLAPDGLFLANVLVKHDFDEAADRAAKAMKAAWSEVRLLDTLGVVDRNAIVMAGQVARLRPPKLLMRPQTEAGGIDRQLRRLQFRPWKSSRWDFRA